MTGPQSPPVFGRLLLALFVPREHHDTVIGDLDEEYRQRGSPRLWYWAECISLSRAFFSERFRHTRWKRAAVRKRPVARWNNDVTRKGRKPEMGVLLKDLRFGFRQGDGERYRQTLARVRPRPF